MLSVEELWKQEYCNDSDLNSEKPTNKKVEEVPYMKNNPRYKKLQEEITGGTTGMTEKQKRNAALRAKLLAP
jgi:hypothetical protein